MNSEFKDLVKDTLNFVRAKKALFFEEAFAIRLESNDNRTFKIAKQKAQPQVQNVKISSEKPQELKKEIIEKKQVTNLVKPKKIYLDNSPKITSNLDNFKDIYRQVAKIDPAFELTSDILDDIVAKKIVSKWKYKLNAYPATILTASNDKDEINFLQAIAKAIEVYFFEAKVVSIDQIEKENQWDEFLKSENIRLIIAIDDQIWNFKNLMTHFKEVPNKSLKTLGEIPLFLVPNLKLYFQNFKLKKSLWKALCQMIAEL